MSKKKKKGNGLRNALIVVIVLLIAAIGVLIWMCLDLVNAPQQEETTPTQAVTLPTEATVPETTVPPEPEHVVSTATILSTGDLLMHGQLIVDAKQDDGTYDFSYIFPYITEYVSDADFAVANLETTLAGTAKPYQGNPMFNCPDEIVDAAKNAGFDMLLTAYNPMQAGGYDIINCFRHAAPEPFYAALETQIAEMRQQGAEAIVLYIHWGQEYKLEPNSYQTAMAQRLCDLGVDVIIGGHPHVVEPVALLESTVDPNHRTVCLYSMGNAVSNQRLGKLKSITTAHTEDGVLFSISFSKYSDGTVYLEDASLIPTWVRAIDANGNTVVRDSATIRRYEILPLDDSRRSQWQEQFGIDDSTLAQCTDSWQRTMDITGAGLNQVQDYLHAEKSAREANYLWIAQNAA
mgnify:CR=1 FL=1